MGAEAPAQLWPWRGNVTPCTSLPTCNKGGDLLQSRAKLNILQRKVWIYTPRPFLISQSNLALDP